MENSILWTCPNCNRQFQRKNQSHSCKIFPLENHFEGKPAGKALFENLINKLDKNLGIFKIQSLECCIHFDHISTFATAKIFRDKIQIEFSLPLKIIDKRIIKIVQLSRNKYLHFTDIYNSEEIDNELIEWMKQANSEKE